MKRIIAILCLFSFNVFADSFWKSLPHGQKYPTVGIWPEISQKADKEQKIQEALQLLVKHLADPAVKKDSVDWTRSLIWRANFQMGLGQAETALDEIHG